MTAKVAVSFLVQHFRIQVFCALLLVPFAFGQGVLEVQSEGEWHGHRQLRFTFEGHGAHLVVPAHAAPSRPWVWRARFPGYHTEVDQLLVERGHHIAYLDTGGMLGSDRAMGLWDRFYEALIAEHELAPRPALEGVSRGGLFVYRWAALHPERVSCIYADTPVCDIRSWPLGDGRGLGHPATWQGLLKEFGMTHAQALEYTHNPIDLMAPIAGAHIPLMTVVSRNDVVVPPAENTDVLATRFRQLGGDICILSVAEGTQASNGHHFTHPDPLRAADFIERHSSGTPTPTGYGALRGGLANCRIRFEQELKGRVAFLGGSITSRGAWQAEVCQYLRSRFPKTDFEFIDAGVPSMGSTPGAFRLESEVLGLGRVDLLFQEAGVNDSTNGRSPQEMIRGMEGVLRQAVLNNPAMDCIVMHFVDPGKMRTYRAGQVPEVVQRHELVADHYGVSTIHLALEVTERIDGGQFTWSDDFKNLHPAPFGHRLYAASIRRLLSEAWDEPWKYESKITAHALPKPMDDQSYDRAMIVALDQARVLKGFDQASSCDPRADGIGGGVRAGFVNVPMLVGTEAGSRLVLDFKGRAVGLWVAAGPDAGVLEHRIDQGPWESTDLFTRWSAGLHLPWVYLLGTDLDGEAHQLEIRIASEKNPKSKGRACRIVRFVVNR